MEGVGAKGVGEKSERYTLNETRRKSESYMLLCLKSVQDAVQPPVSTAQSPFNAAGLREAKIDRIELYSSY